MKNMSLSGFCLGLALAIFAAFPAHAETFVGSNIDSRVILGLGAEASEVQKLLPEGWTSVPFPNGPLKGSNLLVSFVDGVLMIDAEGKPLSPASRRAVVLLGLGREDGGDAVRIYVFRIFTSDPESDPYGVNVAAEISRSNSLTGPAGGGRQSTDAWTMIATGGALSFSLDYTTGKRGWSSSEANSYSAANPDFYRTYRYDNIIDLVMSTAIGKPIAGEFSLSSSVPELAGIFNGSEEVIAILDVPVRVRKIYLP
jgi:hypothetical protein